MEKGILFMDAIDSLIEQIARAVVDLIKKEWVTFGTSRSNPKLGRPPQMITPVAYQMAKEAKSKPFPLHPSKATVKRLTKGFNIIDPNRKLIDKRRTYKTIDGKTITMCKEKGCAATVRSKGLCSRHYQNQRYHEKHPKAKVRKS